jgi:hypothetical protein
MANQVELINLGLSQIKVAPIEALTERSPQAIHVNRIYDIARDATLADVAPKWAKKQEALSESTDEVTGYDYVYTYPAGCLKDLEIYNPAKQNEADTLAYDVGLSASGNSKVILTNYAEAELIYIVRVTNTGVYDMLFVEALALKIALLSAMPLKGDKALLEGMSQAYARAVGNAKAYTRNQGYKVPDASNSFTAARG